MNTDLLKYDAADIRELVRRKLLESGVLTDQIYPGSDTSILIDIFSWMFNVLTYMLNENASDILFSDSSVYENLNKIVRLLSYNPKAYTTSNASFSINLLGTTSFEDSTITCTIPKFASISTSKSDKNGNPVKYTFAEDYSFNIINGIVQFPKKKPILYNGTPTKYVFPMQATGRAFEVFTMMGIGPNGDVPTYIDNDTIHIYVEKVNTEGIKEYEEAAIVKSLVIDSASNDLNCELRLNENKEFEVKFGDGLHGKRLQKGAIVNMVYLASNGPEGVIDSSEVASNILELAIEGFTSKEEMINMVYDGYESFKINYAALFTNNYLPVYSNNEVYLKNDTPSSPVIDYEDVDDIKEFAPSNFRLGNRLVTASDFRTYILHNFKNRVRDAYVCGNNEYCSLFYKWLDKYGQLNANIRLQNYEYASACDFNNVYVWLQPLNDVGVQESDREIIVKSCNKIKSLTAEVVPCTGIKTFFMPFVRSQNAYEITSQVLQKNFQAPTKIVLKKGATYFSDSKIRSNVADIIINYFNEKSSFGETVILSEIQQRILALGYIESIKTVSMQDSKNGYYTAYCDGLSFAKFTPDIISFKDFEVFTQNYSLEKFQYGRLLNPQSIINLIEITNENAFTLRNDEF